MNKETLERCVSDIRNRVLQIESYFGDKVNLDSAIHGTAYAINEIWKSETMWRDLTNNPPKYEGGSYQVLLKHVNGEYSVGSITNFSSGMYYKNQGYVQWRPIEITFQK